MNRRYTGAEARELVARATCPDCKGTGRDPSNDPIAARWCDRCESIGSISPLRDAAPDLAESLAAVEAERDALRVERDALRECLSALEAHAAAYEEFAQAKGRHAEAWELEDKARLEATHRLAQEKYEPVRAANVRLKDATAAVREARK